jgi:hypothetical protein
MSDDILHPVPPWENERRDEAEAAMNSEDEPLEWFSSSSQLGGRATRPIYYDPDGLPIFDDDQQPATLKWATLFEQNRTIGNTRTLYGEMLSTVWLGLDHNYGVSGPPLIFETMLFAPKGEDIQQAVLMARYRAIKGEEPEPDDAALIARAEAQVAYTKKHYPHDQLQLRYATRSEAEDSHDKLKLQCLIPPRWRHFLLWTVGRDIDWQFYDDEDGE